MKSVCSGTKSIALSFSTFHYSTFLQELQEQRWAKVTKEMLHNVAKNPTYIKRIITCDEMWIYEYDVENVQQY